MNNTGINYYQDSEHYLQRMLAGNVSDVRRRLTIALERLDYDFVDDGGEFEIQARRSARGWAGAGASADVLDYSRTLIIKFSPQSETLTRASFIYIVKHPWLQRGEKEVLTREAETLAALSSVRAIDKICAVCGTEATDESRFCRNCGAPMTSDETALEVLRMTAETRSGHTSVAIGTIIALLLALANLAALVALLASSAGNKGAFVFLGVGIFLSLLIVVSNGFGWKRFNNALKMRDKANRLPQMSAAKSIHTTAGGNVRNLAAPPAFSITEDATEMLNSARRTNDLVERRKSDEN